MKWVGGPLAGEVVGSRYPATTGTPWFFELADSKNYLQSKREKLYDIIVAECDVGIGRGTLQDIETLNILWASMLAMERAVGACPRPRREPGAKRLVMPTTCLVLISRSCSIAAASIVAKVTRDRKCWHSTSSPNTIGSATRAIPAQNTAKRSQTLVPAPITVAGSN